MPITPLQHRRSSDLQQHSLPRSSTVASSTHTQARGSGACHMASVGWVVESDVGKRKAMEDAYCHGAMRISCAPASGSEVALGGVFDGHGGDLVAKFIAKNMPAYICSALQAGQPQHDGPAQPAPAVSPALAAEAVHKAFTSLDEQLLSAKAAQLQGSTAVVALVTPQRVHIGSCGDSRAVICQTSRVIQPVADHCPRRHDEQARIKAAGGQVLYHNGARVMGALAMSRAIGDHALRPYGVIAEPDVAHHSRQPEDEFLVVASDGLWATVSNEDVLRITQEALAQLTPLGLTRQQVAGVLPKMLSKVATSRGSTDNITVLILDLKRAPSSSSSSSSSSNGGSAAATAPKAACSTSSNATSAAVDCIKRIISKATLAAWGDRLQSEAPAARPAAGSSKPSSSKPSSGERAPAAALQPPKSQQAGSTTAHLKQPQGAAVLKATPTQLQQPQQQQAASSPAALAGESVSVFVLAAATLAATQDDLEHASPFMNAQQSAALSQVWKDWDSIQQACCSGDCAPGACSCAAAAGAGAPGALANPRKRRMVTTELSAFGSRELGCRETLSAPAQLQHQATALQALDAVLSGPARKKWQMAASSMAMTHQSALQALA